jgi:asparagine synthase (glutamine-hydrolysing)
MCGIAGVLSYDLAAEAAQSAVSAMQERLRHRGPDDEGIWVAPCGRCVLGHRRLSIIDLSSAGRQPISSADGRYTIVFNGEIYNYQALRGQLLAQGASFETHSDTEVILRLYERDGAACVNALRGMFAFAIWDEQERQGFLARDPLGIKPLYLHCSGTTLAFASELRALVGGAVLVPTLNPQAVQSFFSLGTVPEPMTLVNEVVMLGAGQTLTWKEGVSKTQTFWQVEFPQGNAPTDARRHTREALLDSMRHHMVSDVPVGLFLSGGIDSTAILALTTELGHKGLSAFCIAVDDEAADESSIAQRTAEHFGAEYHQLELNAESAQHIFKSFQTSVDQPSIDGLNTFTVSSLANSHGMKVVLSGLGGDELFGGYASFSKVPQMAQAHRLVSMLPFGRDLAARALAGSPRGRRMGEFLRSDGSLTNAYESFRAVFSKAEAAQLTHWICGADVALPTVVSERSFPDAGDTVSYFELTRYMRNQLLRDSDVMSMAHSLELRVPFVDKELFTQVANIPSEIRLRAGKRLLTEAVPEVPDWVVNQKKRGFLFPYHKWLASEWSEVFDQATEGAPVPMPNWYQKWAVYMLRNSCAALNLTLK